MNKVGYGDLIHNLQDTAYAAIRMCTFEDVYHDGVGTAYNFSILVSNDWNWYWKASPNLIVPGQIDMQSVLTHEFGHATGRVGTSNNGHFSGSVCNAAYGAAGDQTMCAQYPSAAVWFRSLEEHDLSAFADVLGYD